MKYKISEANQRRLEQFARSNFAELLHDILRDREKQLNDFFRSALPENFLEVKGRALEIDDLFTVLKIKERD